MTTNAAPAPASSKSPPTTLQQVRDALTKAGHHAHPGNPADPHSTGGHHANETSTAAIRVAYRLGPDTSHLTECQRALLTATTNDDYAACLLDAGFRVSRRGAGVAVYAYIPQENPASAAPPRSATCERTDHQGAPAPWIAVLPGRRPYESEYACRACVAQYRA